jgi:hypothetical protein
MLVVYNDMIILDSDAYGSVLLAHSVEKKPKYLKLRNDSLS